MALSSLPENQWPNVLTTEGGERFCQSEGLSWSEESSTHFHEWPLLIQTASWIQVTALKWEKQRISGWNIRAEWLNGSFLCSIFFTHYVNYLFKVFVFFLGYFHLEGWKACFKCLWVFFVVVCVVFPLSVFSFLQLTTVLPLIWLYKCPYVRWNSLLYRKPLWDQYTVGQYAYVAADLCPEQEFYLCP